MMKLEKAIQRLREKYNSVRSNVHIIDPVAFALYEVWKEADVDRQKKQDSHLKVELIETIRKIYAKYPVGGSMHIVLDDLNVGDDSIRFCQKQLPIDVKQGYIAKEDEAMFARCASLLFSIKPNERVALIIKAIDD